jgi:hypothetical protein
MVGTEAVSPALTVPTCGDSAVSFFDASSDVDAVSDCPHASGAKSAKQTKINHLRYFNNRSS